MHGHSYNVAERALHHLALGSRSIAEITFDLNAVLSPRAIERESDGRHVFVSGLARAGTTIIMRRLHETGLFRSLTYRDMPFVLCPSLWERLSSLSHRNIEAVERAHGDRLKIDADSPEALDEVFWRVFAGRDYIRSDHLCAHAVDRDLIEKFRQYVSYILRSQDRGDPKQRYLSKNNNNILRLDAVQAAFPRSVIVIPFRDPVQHANSLLGQHVKFCRQQGGDPFARSYMTWLAHHEFGLEHKPFWFDVDKPYQPSPYRPDSINYWLDLWLRVYGWLLANRPQNSLLVCYEDLCSSPDAWNRLLDCIDIEKNAKAAESVLSRSEDKEVDGLDAALVTSSRALYSELHRGSKLKWRQDAGI